MNPANILVVLVVYYSPPLIFHLLQSFFAFKFTIWKSPSTTPWIRKHRMILHKSNFVNYSGPTWIRDLFQESNAKEYLPDCITRTTSRRTRQKAEVLEAKKSKYGSTAPS